MYRGEDEGGAAAAAGTRRGVDGTAMNLVESCQRRSELIEKP